MTVVVDWHFYAIIKLICSTVHNSGYTLTVEHVQSCTVHIPQYSRPGPSDVPRLSLFEKQANSYNSVQCTVGNKFSAQFQQITWTRQTPVPPSFAHPSVTLLVDWKSKCTVGGSDDAVDKTPTQNTTSSMPFVFHVYRGRHGRWQLLFDAGKDIRWYGWDVGSLQSGN